MHDLVDAEPNVRCQGLPSSWMRLLRSANTAGLDPAQTGFPNASKDSSDRAWDEMLYRSYRSSAALESLSTFSGISSRSSSYLGDAESNFENPRAPPPIPRRTYTKASIQERKALPPLPESLKEDGQAILNQRNSI